MPPHVPLRRREPGVTVAQLRASLDVPPLAEVAALYERARFLDAHALTRSAWDYDAVSLALTIDEMILAARLALRLGSPRRHALLTRLARRRTPRSPLVALYGATPRFHQGSIYSQARLYQADVPEGPPDVQVDWLCVGSTVLALLRDFEAASQMLERARQLEPESSWIDTCAALVQLEQGHWSQAEALASAAWERRPGTIQAASILVRAQAKQAGARPVIERLLQWIADGGQSYEVLMVAVVALLDVARSRTGGEAVRLAARAREASAALEGLAPLADPRVDRMFAFVRAEASRLMGDHERVRQYARDASSPFYEDVAQRLQAGAKGPRAILDYSPVAQQHDTCVPASVATCASVLGIEVDQDAVASTVTWGGTAMWRVLELAKDRDWVTHVFTVDEATATALLERGLPFVVTLLGAEIGHACAAVGIDPAIGTLILHDPAGPSIREMQLDKLHVGQAPLGPMGLVFVPAQSPAAAMLDELSWPGEDDHRAYLEMERLLTRRSAKEAAEYSRAHASSSALGTYLRGLGGLVEGRPHAELEALRALAREYPDNAAIQAQVVRCAEAAGHTGRLIEILEPLVLQRRRAGVESQQAWFEPPPGLVARYASLLRGRVAERPRVERLLHQTLAAASPSGPCMYALADLLWEEQRFEDALWAYRWASTLQPESERSARIYAWALKKRGRLQDGLQWLRARAETSADHRASSAEPWVSWVQMLEQFGDPQAALQQARAVAEQESSSGEQAAYAVQLLARYGRNAEAHRALAIAKERAPVGLYHTAASVLATSEGQPQRALEHAVAWDEQEPGNLGAFELRVSLLRQLQGPETSLDLVRQRMEERPGNAEVESLLLAELEQHDASEERERILEARIEHNPLESWALRELSWSLVNRARRSTGPAREAMVERAEALMRTAGELDPDNPATCALRAELAVARGDLEQGVHWLAEAMIRDPDYGYALPRLRQLVAQQPAKQRPAVIDALDRVAEVARHDLGMARDGVALIANLIGFEPAEQALMRWSARSPDDPRIIEARADLYLDSDQGRSAAQRMLGELEAAEERYPLHAGLRLSLARAYRMLDRRVDALAVYGRLAHDFPTQPALQGEIASFFAESGEPDTAVELLEEVVRRSPGFAPAWLWLSGRLADMGRRDEAIEVLRKAHALMSSEPDILERLAVLLAGQGPEGVEESLTVVARAVERHPSSAAIRCLQAGRLAATGAPPAVVDEAFTAALAADRHRWETVHDYTLQLMLGGRYDEALTVLDEYGVENSDPSVVEGQRARILRHSGRRAEALQTLCSALQRYPDYAWGWTTFMDWVQEDDEPDIARRTLRRLSSSLSLAPVLQAQALLTWKWAGTAADKLEARWDQLMADHGHVPAVALTRADLLLVEGRHDEAEQVITRLPAGQRSQPTVLARLAKIHLARGEEDAALADLRAAWRVPGTAGEIARSTLRAIDEAGWSLSLADAMIEDLEAGEHVAGDATRSLAYAIADRDGPPQLDRLARLVDQQRGPHALRLLSFIFDAMCGVGRTEPVLAWEREHPAAVQEDSDLWHAVAHALRVADRFEDVVAWFEGWRDRDGLEMWGVDDYLSSLWLLERWAECRDETRWAVAHVAPDRALPRLLRRLLDADLEVGAASPQQEFSDFVEDYERFGHTLALGGARDWEVEVYAALHQLLASGSEDRISLAATQLGKLRRERGLDWDRRVEVGRGFVTHHLSWWRRLWIWV